MDKPLAMSISDSRWTSSVGNHPILDNVLWEAFSHGQPQFTVGDGGMRRYAPGFSTIVAWQDPTNPDFSALNKVAAPGDSFYCDQWSGEAPEGWSIEAETTMFKMVWEADIPEPVDHKAMITLGPEHAERALELALLTNPGPFGIRTVELGDYYGYFDGERLVAMSGERMVAPPYREVSAVCTHPDFQGRGLAKKLMLRLIRQEIERGEIPFLHVLSANEVARGMYQRMGFRDYLETTVRVIKRLT